MTVIRADSIYKLFYAKIESLLAQNKAIEYSSAQNKGEIPIALAVSGGADSMCLAALMKSWAELQLKTGSNCVVKLYCLIVDHQLRSDSTSEAEYVHNLLSSLGFNSKILTWSEKNDIDSNLQHHARNARYKLISQFCSENNIKFLCTAHNYDDQAETVLMRIIRGSGIDGVSGIPEYGIIDKKLRLLRPLLMIRRKEIESLLKEINWSWVEDPTNSSDKYHRNRIRKFLRNCESYGLPDYELLSQRLVLLSKNTTRAKNFLEDQTKIADSNVCYHSLLGYSLLDLDKFINLDEEIGLRLLRFILIKVSGSEYSTRLNSLELLYNSLLSKYKHYLNNEPDTSNFSITLSGCLISFLKRSNYAIIIREQKAIKKELLPLTIEKSTTWDNRFDINYPANIYNDVNKKQLFVGPLNSSCWSYLSQLKREGKLTLEHQNFKIKLPYHKIMMTTPVIFDENNTAVYYPLLKLIDSRFIAFP